MPSHSHITGRQSSSPPETVSTDNTRPTRSQNSMRCSEFVISDRMGRLYLFAGMSTGTAALQALETENSLNTFMIIFSFSSKWYVFEDFW